MLEDGILCHRFVNLGAPVGKSVKVVAFCLQLGQQGVHSFLLAPYKFVKALGYGCYFFLILRHDLLHLAEGFFERISAIHILIPFAVYQEMIEFFSLFVGLEYLVKRFKVFVIYEYFSKIKNQILYHDISSLCYYFCFHIPSRDTLL